LGVDAGDEAILAVGVLLALLGVELPGFAGHALGDDFGVFVDQNRHVGSLLDRSNDLGGGISH
jgi:hypothetical protein